MRTVATSLRRLKSDTSGNIMYITAALIFPMIALIGSGIDLGKAYMAKGRLQQACDAGVLAGRRAMTDKTFSTAAQTAARNMFNANYAQNLYESQGLTFSPALKPNSTTEVTATARASIPTSLMYVFGKEVIDISVRCTAKLEAANADIMFVLDTTASMTEKTPDGKTRIQALRDEVMRFFDTVSTSQSDSSTIRYGIMPYSGNVNVAMDLYEANPNWLSNYVTLPSRVLNRYPRKEEDIKPGAPNSWSWHDTFIPDGTTLTPTSNVNNTATTAELCRASNSGQGRFEHITKIGTTTYYTDKFTDANGNYYEISDVSQNYQTKLFTYKWDGDAGTCREYMATGTAIETTRTEIKTVRVDTDYTYKDVTYDITPAKSGNAVLAPVEWDGSNRNGWPNYCIMERDTVQLDPSATTAPARAYDLNIDLIPYNEATRWHALIPNIAFSRTGHLINEPNPQERQTGEGISDYGDVNARVSLNFTPCPSRAMKLRALRSTDRSILQAQVNALKPEGFTYHDVGMIWGARYLSPTGIFAASNPATVNGMPVDKHIVFMTDGEMDTNFMDLTFQGAEGYAQRVGGSNKAELDARHAQRFRIACDAAKARGMTIWVVAFGTNLNSDLRYCASGEERAFQASSAADLANSFQSIAGSISRLRLSE